jgi:hypothetical protein
MVVPPLLLLLLLLRGLGLCLFELPWRMKHAVPGMQLRLQEYLVVAMLELRAVSRRALPPLLLRLPAHARMLR